MVIKCSKEEKIFLIKYLGEELTEKLPWWDDEAPTCIAEELNSLQLREGFENQQRLNKFGKEIQKIYDSLLEQNG